MYTNSNDPKTSSSDNHDGFIWSQYARLVVAFGLALVLAAARFAPALANSGIWQR